MYKRLKKLASKALLSALLFAAVSLQMSVNAQLTPQERASFLSDPLADQERDPLLPQLAVEREYSPLERQTIRTRLDSLSEDAADLRSQGETDIAFSLWMRELRLRRILGITEEFAAIRRVAAIAWAEQRPTEIQLLTLRTRELWEATQRSLGTLPEEDFPRVETPSPNDSLLTGAPTADLATLEDLADTFTTLRDIENAIAVSLQIIETLPPDSEQQVQRQIELAEQYLAWFRFAEGANLYRQLLIDLRERTSAVLSLEIYFLERLVYSYEQADSLPNALRAQTDLIPFYESDPEKLPALLVAIAQNYRDLDQPNNAISYYRAAYQAAQRFEQFSFSARVLQDLGALYRSLDRLDEALNAYQLLVPVEQQAYNDYGQMNAQDLIGQLQRQQGNNRDALIAFQRALVLANRLGLPDAYFIEQIESVTP